MIDPILARTAPLFADAVRGYLAGGTPAAFERAMQQALAQAHTAAYLRGVAERSAVGRVREWLGRLIGDRALSKDDRTALRTALREQFKFLGGFVEQLGGMSEAQVAARAALYAASAKATYWQAWAGGSLPAYPGDGSSECLTNCKCRWEKRGEDYYWIMGANEHCSTCQTRASSWAPYRP